MFIHTESGFLKVDHLYKTLSQYHIECSDIINHQNKIYSLTPSKQSLTIFEYSNTCLKPLMDLNLDKSIDSTSDIFIGKNSNFKDIIGFINHSKEHISFEIYELNEHQIPLLYTHRTIYLDFIASNHLIDRILYQDGFYYLVQLHFDKKETCIYVLKPDMSEFGKITIPCLCLNSMLAGKYLFYHSEYSIHKYDILQKCFTDIVLHMEYPIQCYTFNLTHLYIIDKECQCSVYEFDPNESNYKNILPEYVTHLDISDFQHQKIHKIIHSEWGNDFQHHLSCMKKCYVETFFPSQMDKNQKYINDILTELAINLYSNEKNKKVLFDIRESKLQLNNFRDINKLVYIGNDLKDILNPPRGMFDKFYGYQHILNDMESLLNIKDKATLNHFIDFVKNKGIDVNYSYIMSGRFHLIKPNHAKGWHNNIESVPKGTAEVIYFVITDVNEFGGSFFLYRHPYTKMIHAVPDISGTYKKFYLIGDENKPLWHAIGSFTANRISLGYSKRSDLELYEHSKPDIFY